MSCAIGLASARTIAVLLLIIISKHSSTVYKKHRHMLDSQVTQVQPGTLIRRPERNTYLQIILDVFRRLYGGTYDPSS